MYQMLTKAGYHLHPHRARSRDYRCADLSEVKNSKTSPSGKRLFYDSGMVFRCLVCISQCCDEDQWRARASADIRLYDLGQRPEGHRIFIQGISTS